MITVVSVEKGGYYSGKYASGNTVDVTLTDGETIVRVEQVLMFEEDDASLEDMFDEAVDLAYAGIEGYAII